MAGLEQSDTDPTASYVDPQGDPFLRTRFAIPARPETFLRRERLVSHLDQALRTPLTMVNGAAGAGKTLLVADWAAARDLPVAWLTTDAAEQGPGMLWAYLLQALRASGASLPAGIGCPADASRVPPNLLARLAAELSVRDRPVTVVLDEYDRMIAPEVADQLEFVLHHAGDGLRLILVTRTEPLLPLHRYRAAGDLTEIRGAELAFTSQEAAELLDLHGLRLAAHATQGLVDRTRGWAAGLRLCALAAREHPDPETYLKEFEADHSTVADFLLAEVLRRQPPETQDVLLRVSVLDRFRPELVNALTERTDAGPILAGLHRENAFVEHLGQDWYRLHPLFAEILRAHLRMRSPGLEPELHRRAARWLRGSGSLTETLGQGAAAGDWEFTAGALIDDFAIGWLFTGLGSEELADLFARMGPEATGPATDLVRAARELSRRDLDRGLRHLRDAEQGLTAGLGPTVEPGAAAEQVLTAAWTAAGEEPGMVAARLSCALLETLAGRLTGEPGRAERAAAAAEALCGRAPAHLLERHPELTALLLAHLGSARLWAGRFDEACAALSQVAGSGAGASTALAREDSLGGLALIDYLDGWLGRAERKARAAVTVTERYGLPQPSGSGMGRLVLAAVAVDRDDLGRARRLLAEAAGAGGTDPALEDPVMEAGRAIATARLHLARGDTRAALEAAERAVPATVVSPWAAGQTALVVSAVHLAEGRPETAVEVLRAVSGEQPACAVAAARAHLAAGRPGVAIDLLDDVRPQGRAGPAVTVRALLVRAQAADRAGDAATARRLVAQALREARRDGLRRPFGEAGPWIRPLLDAMAPRVRRADRGAPGAAASDGPPLPLVEELSGRERDVLSRLALTMSTEEIAADLFVSVNTVKTHLKSVYRKLAVNRRNDAVRRARELKLL
ncbi:LuxR C-terminal-related transcriptional regulator [Streptomyces rishiriensis]|uniref:LuxR family maltose regulon positive regulatory protein n=1 Tax=Streptomyces rishiriensis TaxID=68264 RepID=A0ABU0NKJ7_STRRH|nr:LuxR C-terminal-related transcriptional regulator [Streptomyces rishiriensis]MDQ0579641.1 LuxR family maltose regulon positive regulatory protein [Streptomyces rishiriensis]